MLKTLYAIGMALPRILLKPFRGFELIIPETHSPFIMELSTIKNIPLSEDTSPSKKEVVSKTENKAIPDEVLSSIKNHCILTEELTKVLAELVRYKNRVSMLEKLDYIISELHERLKPLRHVSQVDGPQFKCSDDNIRLLINDLEQLNKSLQGNLKEGGTEE